VDTGSHAKRAGDEYFERNPHARVYLNNALNPKRYAASIELEFHQDKKLARSDMRRA